MRRTTKIILIVFISALLLLGIGYAAIQNITLNILGTASADPSQSNFKIMFTGTPEVSDNTYATAEITDDTKATINVNGLTEKGQKVSVIYLIQNVSTDLSGDLSVITTNSNTEYFTISSKLAKTSLTAGEPTTVTVTVELTKTPLAESVTSTIRTHLVAVPVQPGEEGSSGTTDDYSQTPEPTLSLVTNNNIGDYINLGNNIIGTEATTDDWRIFYKDENTVYVILADYLPATLIPTTLGLDVNINEYKYSVWSNIDRDTIINGLLNTNAWIDFANGIRGATAIGSPTMELLIDSYNVKSGEELEYIGYQTLDNSISGYDLYVPHPDEINRCNGYWLASPFEITTEDCIWTMCSNDVILDYSYINTDRSVRPVVSLPISTTVEVENGIWHVKKSDTNGGITNNNIGDYIDLGNNIVKTINTTDDWRILYKDNNNVYAILSDYLPTEYLPTIPDVTTCYPLRYIFRKR